MKKRKGKKIAANNREMQNKRGSKKDWTLLQIYCHALACDELGILCVGGNYFAQWV